MSAADRFADSDAAYVLGALPPDERAEFEEHLASCLACAVRVADLTDLPSALGRVTVQDVQELSGAADPVPDTMLPSLLRAARARRRRRVLAAAGAVAACVAAAVIALAVVRTRPASAQALQQVIPTPVHATVQLTSRTWGTEVTLTCRYEQSTFGARPYTLVAVDRSGQRYDLGSWSIAPGQSLTFTSGTALPADQIGELDVTAVGGPAILTLHR